MDDVSRKKSISALFKVIDIVGNTHKLTNILCITHQRLRHWKYNGVPAEWVIKLEKACDGKIKRTQIRPDIYPEE